MTDRCPICHLLHLAKSDPDAALQSALSLGRASQSAGHGPTIVDRMACDAHDADYAERAAGRGRDAFHLWTKGEYATDN